MLILLTLISDQSLREKPQLAREHDIVAIPTLVRELPVLIRKIVGDLSDACKVVMHLKAD